MTVTLTLPPDVEGAIRDAARRDGRTAEETITDALHALFAPDAEDYGEADRAEQERLHALMAQALAGADAAEPEPPDSPTRRAAREAPVAQGVVEKFRRQGLRL